jgi:SagB-type dehydrogenase family enzyme
MATRALVLAVAVLASVLASCGGAPAPGSIPSFTPGDPFPLPDLPAPGTAPLEELIEARRSLRDYTAAPLGLDVVGRLLWAAQGITQEGGVGRAAPSAGGTYPLEIYAATADGLLHYLPDGHRARWITGDDLRPALHDAALGQEWVLAAPAVFVITAVPARTAASYGDRAERYVILEAGHAAQNLLLQATALGLGSVPVGAFHDDQVARALGLADGEDPLYLVPVGQPSE